jgi:hypothetical protein
LVRKSTRVSAIVKKGGPRCKWTNKRLPALEVLEFRQTVSDSLFAGLQLAGAISFATADRSLETNLLEISVAGTATRRDAQALEHIAPEAIIAFVSANASTAPSFGSPTDPRFNGATLMLVRSRARRLTARLWSDRSTTIAVVDRVRGKRVSSIPAPQGPLIHSSKMRIIRLPGRSKTASSRTFQRRAT